MNVPIASRINAGGHSHYTFAVDDAATCCAARGIPAITSWDLPDLTPRMGIPQRRRVSIYRVLHTSVHPHARWRGDVPSERSG